MTDFPSKQQIAEFCEIFNFENPHKVPRNLILRQTMSEDFVLVGFMEMQGTEIRNLMHDIGLSGDQPYVCVELSFDENGATPIRAYRWINGVECAMRKFY